MLNVLIIGGDARYLEIIEGLRKKGANVFLIGYEKISFEHPTIFTCKHADADFSIMDAIILPVHGTTNEGKVTSAYSDEDFTLNKDMIDKTPTHCVIYTGTTNDFLNEAVANRKLEVLFARDDIAIYNAIPTAEATLQLAIEHTDYTIHGSNVIVLGFGRVGFTVARLFKNVGANVTVCVRNSADVARISEMGMNPLFVTNLHQEIEHSELCINTVPHPLLDRNLITKMNPKTLVIDLASAPGGTDFESAKDRGIHAIHALGLPGKTAPKTAGQIIANTIISLMESIEKQ